MASAIFEDHAFTAAATQQPFDEMAGGLIIVSRLQGRLKKRKEILPRPFMNTSMQWTQKN